MPQKLKVSIKATLENVTNLRVCTALLKMRLRVTNLVTAVHERLYLRALLVVVVDVRR